GPQHHSSPTEGARDLLARRAGDAGEDRSVGGRPAHASHGRDARQSDQNSGARAPSHRRSRRAARTTRRHRTRVQRHGRAAGKSDAADERAAKDSRDREDGDRGSREGNEVPTVMLADADIDALASFAMFEQVPRAELEWLALRADARQYAVG